MKIKVKFNGIHPLLCDFPNFVGIAEKNDIIEVEKDFYITKLKQRKHNNKSIWTEVKKEAPISEMEGLQPKDD